MGAMKNQEHEQRDSRRRRNKQPQTQVHWSDLPGEVVLDVISAIDGFSGAVRFGRNRAGTAYSLGIYGDGDHYTEYHEGIDGAVSWLEGIAADYRD